jgi:hypothetical protein
MRTTAELDLLARERDYLASEQRLMDEADALGWVVPECPAELLEGPWRGEPPCDCSCCAEPLATARLVPASPEAGWAVPGVTPDRLAVPSRDGVGAEVAALVSQVEALAAVAPASIEPRRALAEAEALVRTQGVLRTLMLGRLADVETRELYVLAGRKGIRGWLRQVGPDVVPSDVTLGKKLGRLPVLDEALSSGRISIGAAQQVRKSLDRLRPYLDRPSGLIDEQPAEPALANVIAEVQDLIASEHCGLEDDDPLLIAVDEQLGAIVLSALDGTSQAERLEQAFTVLATHVPPGPALGRGLERLVYALLPNELEREQAAAEGRRSLSLTPRSSGGWELRADLTPEAGERVFAALGAEARRDSHNPLDTEAWQALRAQAEREGRDVADLLAEHPDLQTTDAWTGADDPEALHPTDARGIDLSAEPARTRSDGSVIRPRLKSQRLHDAFNNLLDRYLSNGLGGKQGKVPVQATVVITDKLVEGQPGALPAMGASGRPLARSLIRKWWNNMHITALLMSRGYQPLSVVHTGRTVTGQELKALLAQNDFRCVGTDCCEGLPDPLRPLIPHHIERFADNGTTCLTETALICDVFHDDIHVGKRTVQLRDGRWINESGIVPNPHDQPSVWD